MSIIYDSLKKVEGKVDSGVTSAAPAASRPERTRKPSVAFYVFSGVAVCVGVIAASVLFRFLNNAATSSRPASGRIKGLRSGIIPKATAALKFPPVPFAPPVSSQEQVAQKEIPEEQASDQALPFVLNGVFSSDNGSYALIDNQIVKPGDMIGGAKLIRVTSDGAELELNGRTVTLSTRRK